MKLGAKWQIGYVPRKLYLTYYNVLDLYKKGISSIYPRVKRVFAPSI